MVGRTNTGGGGSGGTLVVTGVVGSTVTASKDGKTYSRTINSSGTATFKGLASGTWTVTMSNGTETATRTVTIDADYALTIAYFSASIKITYPASSTCTVTDSTGATVASDTNTGSSTKTWTATVNATGTYTITATNGDKTTSKSVSITTEGQVESVTLSFELVLFDGGVVSGFAWDKSSIDGVGCGDAKVDNGFIYLYGYTWDNGLILKSGWGKIGLSKAIDLTEYNTLKVRLNKTDSALGTAKIQVGTTALGDDAATATVTLAAGTVSSLDISSITGSKYISLYAYSDTGTFGNIIRAYFDKVWLE